MGDPKEIFFSVLPEARKIAFEIKRVFNFQRIYPWCMGAGAGGKERVRDPFNLKTSFDT